MGYKLRLFLDNTPQHILLQSIDSLLIFEEEEDRLYFKELINVLLNKYQIVIYAYIIKEGFFEFIATPPFSDSIQKFMQNIARLYATYFNKKYKRKGTIWKGRYKSSIVEATNYLLEVMCHIESKANFNSNSSQNKNLHGLNDEIISHHELYLKLGNTQEERILNYKLLFQNLSLSRTLTIENALQKQMITGSEEYKKFLQEQFGIALHHFQRGRPKKQETHKEKKMYKNLQVLDKKKHQDLKIKPLNDLQFAKHIAFIPTLAHEISMIGVKFPVVFGGDKENPSLITIVGLGNDNLALNNEGKWITNYIPSYLRKYPFSLAKTKENSEQRVILIDEDSSLFSKTEGSPLFNQDEQSPALVNAIQFLSSYDQHTTLTQVTLNEIAKNDILDEREIAVGNGDEKKVLVNGFKVVDKEKLFELDDAILASWVRNGIMNFIDAHLKSLENIQVLFDLLSQRQK